MKVKSGILKGEFKVKGGKLIKCRIDLHEGRIKNIKITGDFFMYPEDAIEKMEEALKGVEFEKKEIRNAIENSLKDVELIGVSIDDFVTVMMNAATE